jgi:hypothetical protein
MELAPLPLQTRPKDNPLAKPRTSDAHFGFLSAPLLTQSLQYLENKPLAETVVKDITGFNIPKIALTRTWKERWDVTTLELSNTGITLGSSIAMPWLLRKPVEMLSQVPAQELWKKGTEELSSAAKTARVGHAFGFLIPFASLFWAAPFFRNWLTVVRTKTANFEAIIGLDKNNASKSGRTPEQEKAFQLKQMWKVLGTGFGLGAAALVGFGLAAKGMGTKPLGKTMEQLYEKFTLKGDWLNQLQGGAATLIFWSLPAYLGWLHAARSKNEFKEQALKAANSIFWFSVFNFESVNKALYLKSYQKILPELTKVPTYDQILNYAEPLKGKLVKLKNAQNLGNLVFSIGMLAAAPQLLNIYLTKRRFAREHGGLTQAQVGARPAQPTLQLKQNSPFARLQLATAQPALA